MFLYLYDYKNGKGCVGKKLYFKIKGELQEGNTQSDIKFIYIL